MPLGRAGGQTFSSGIYPSNHLSESIHILTMVTLEGWHLRLDSTPQISYFGVGLEFKT